MLKGIDINQVSEFSIKNDSDPKTIFLLKPLTGYEMLEASQKLKGETSINADYVEAVLDKAITGIKDPDISEVNDINKFVEGLDSLVLIEIVTEVIRINDVSDDESKN